MAVREIKELVSASIPEPIYTYYWVVILDDNETAIPQYDPATGEENPWGNVPINHIVRGMWYPFDEYLARKVYAKHGVLAIPSLNPVITYDFPHGSVPKIYRVHEQTSYDYYHCNMCGNDIFWDGEGILECPRCLATNDWYCKRCKLIIDDPIFLKNGEVRCPNCEKKGDPYGLIRTGNLTLRYGFRHDVFYCIGHDDIILKYDEKGNLIEKSHQMISQDDL